VASPKKIEKLIRELERLTVTEFLAVLREVTGTQHHVAIVPMYEEDDRG